MLEPNMTDSPPKPEWKNLDVLLVLVVNDTTRHVYKSLSDEDLEDGIYLAATTESFIPDSTEHKGDGPLAVQVLLSGFESMDEAEAVCHEIYDIRRVMPEDKKSLGDAVMIWMQGAQNTELN